MRIIAGEARGRKLLPPKDLKVRPLLDRIRESLFSQLMGLAGARVLDLYAGVGSFGLEALSRGARHATFVEKERAAFTVLERNAANLGFGARSRLIRGDALLEPDLGGVEPPRFNIIFFDPPFRVFDRLEEAGRVFRRLEEVLERAVVQPGGAVLLRLPAAAKVKCPLPAKAERRYGESLVLWL